MDWRLRVMMRCGRGQGTLLLLLLLLLMMMMMMMIIIMMMIMIMIIIIMLKLTMLERTLILRETRGDVSDLSAEEHVILPLAFKNAEGDASESSVTTDSHNHHRNSQAVCRSCTTCATAAKANTRRPHLPSFNVIKPSPQAAPFLHWQ